MLNSNFAKEMKLKVEIVNLSKALASTASSIYAKSWKVAYKGILPQKYLDNLSVENLTLYLENSPFQNFLLKDNDNFVATASIAKARDCIYKDYGEIVSLYVLPDYFNKGYGTFLLNNMFGKIQSMELNKICLWVLDENRNAR